MNALNGMRQVIIINSTYSLLTIINKNKFRLIFQHPTIVNIQSPILEGDYKDRRIAFFSNMENVVSSKNELERIVNILMEEMDKLGGGI